jgi:hypothetical protein
LVDDGAVSKLEKAGLPPKRIVADYFPYNRFRKSLCAISFKRDGDAVERRKAAQGISEI